MEKNEIYKQTRCVLINHLYSKENYKYCHCLQLKKMTVPVVVNFIKQINLCGGNIEEFR